MHPLGAKKTVQTQDHEVSGVATDVQKADGRHGKAGLQSSYTRSVPPNFNRLRVESPCQSTTPGPAFKESRLFPCLNISRWELREHAGWCGNNVPHTLTEANQQVFDHVMSWSF